jgi:hypothetical protein
MKTRRREILSTRASLLQNRDQQAVTTFRRCEAEAFKEVHRFASTLKQNFKEKYY